MTGAKYRLFALLATAGTMYGAAPVAAQESPPSVSTDSRALEEIVVTAERRTANAQKTATAVSVRSGEELAREGRFSLNQILEDIPGVSGLSGTGFQNLGTDAPETGITIRGVRSNNGPIGPAVSSTTALYVDGVYGGIGGNYDIGRVEVLRGPQGTLYGRSATGGVVATYTRAPETDEIGGNALIEIGNYALRHYSAVVNVPIVTDTLAIRVSGNRFRRDGFDSAAGGRTESDDARVKVLWKPTTNLSLLLGFALQNTFAGTGGVTLRAVGLNGVVKDTSTPVGSGTGHTRQYWAQLDWDLGPARVTYIPAYRDYGQTGIFYPSAPVSGYYANTLGEPSSTYHTQELRVASPTGSRLTWQFGGIYFENIVDGYYSEQILLNSGAFSSRREISRRVTNVGVFAEGTYPITDAIRVTAGLRHDWDEIRTNALLLANKNRNTGSGTATVGLPVVYDTPHVISGDAGKQDVEETTYKVRLEADLGADSLVYGMVSTAFLPGDVQITATIPPTPNTYSAEKLTAYEIGSKNRFFGGRLQVNGAAYFYDYGGYQTTVTPDPSNPSVQTLVSQPMQMKGAELETLFQITPSDRIGFDIAYVDARFVKITPAFRAVVSQERLFGLPPLTMSLRYDHDFRLSGGSKLRFNAGTRYSDSYYAYNASTLLTNQGALQYVRTKRMIIGDAALDWTSADGRFGIGGYVRNITDQRFKVIGSVIFQSVTPLNQTFRLSEPRTFGVLLHANF